MSFAVVKVGGSLLDLSDFRVRLQTWIDQQDSKRILIVPGGGRLVEQIRHLDRIHQFGEEASHWLAIEAMNVNSMILSSHLTGTVVRSFHEAEVAWSKYLIAILDPRPFCREVSRASSLPHTWDVTSDSIAACVAMSWHAMQLVLLKSAPPPDSFGDWSAIGYCDPWFNGVLASSNIDVIAVNLREIAH